MRKIGDQLHQVGVVVIPFPAQGHLNPLLQLSHLLTTTYRLPVHYLCSTTHIRQAKLRAHLTSPDPTNQTHIQFNDLEFFPNLDHKTNPNTKVPTHLQSMYQSIYSLRQPISEFIKSISSKFKRLIVIHDSLMASVVVHNVKAIKNAESYTFHTSSAFSILLTMLELKIEKKPFETSLDDGIIPTIVPSCQAWSSPEFEKFITNQYHLLSFSSGRLYNTCRALEVRYLDLLQQLPVNDDKKLFAIGPIDNCFKSSTSSYKNHSSVTKHSCLEWLDKQEKESVIYVSFGTTTSMSQKQINELAKGLEMSQQKFIWVLREADKVDIFKDNCKNDSNTTTTTTNNNNNNGRTVKCSSMQKQLLQDYEERVKGRGLIIREWAPQVAILGHVSIGGFMSHCGWNSCIESISMGVPIAAWPMHSDQPKNAVLVTDFWKAGVVVRDWSSANDDQVVKASVIEKAVRRLMDSKEGDEIRVRTKQLGFAVRDSVSIGGSSCLEMDAFVAHIIR